MKRIVFAALVALIALLAWNHRGARSNAVMCPAFLKDLKRYPGKITSSEPFQVTYAFPLRESRSSFYDLISTEMKLPKEKPQANHPRLRYIRYLGDHHFAEDESFPVILTEHAREILPVRLHGKKAFVIADHGFDWPPFAGGQPRLIVNENGHWQDETALRFPLSRSFNFNVSAFSLNNDGNIDFFFNTVNSDKWVSFFLKNDGHDHFSRTEQLPKELTDMNVCYMTSRYWGRDGESEYIFLGGCDRAQDAPKVENDRLLRIQNGKMELMAKDRMSPRFQNAAWGTVDIQPIDINGDGERDVVTAVHNEGFTIGGIQIYLKKQKEMAFQTPKDGYIQTTDVSRPSFVPSVRLGDLDGDGYPEMVAPIVPIHPDPERPLNRYFALYHGRPDGFEDVTSCLHSSLGYVAYADIAQLKANSKPEIFLLGYDGSFEFFGE